MRNRILVKWILSKYKLFTICIFFLLLLQAILQAQTALQSAPIVTIAVSANPVELGLYHYIARYIAIVLCLIVCVLLKQLIINELSARFEKDLYVNLLDQIIHTRISIIDPKRANHYLALLTTDLRTVKSCVQNALPDLIYQPILFFYSMFFMIKFNFIVALIIIVLVSTMTFLTNYWGKKLQEATKNLRSAKEEELGIEQSSLTSLEAIRSSNMEDYIISRKEAVSTEIYEWGKQSAIIKAKHYVPTSITEYGPTVLILAVGCYLLYTAQIELGQLTAWIQLLAYICLPISKLSRNIVSYKAAKPSWIQLQMMSDDVEQNAEEVGQLRIYPCQNSPLYKCHNLSFRYSEDMGFVLHNINLTIEKGEKICIIGDSGCGKTTLIKMMLGIYPVYQGSLQWMGCEIRKVDREQLWSQVSYLSSEQYILPGSIEDNLSPGEPIDNKRWEQAVDMASLQDLVLEQSILMQNGKNLSGGQKQRIGIARVYYRGTPVLFLDEPTSAMDSESEKHCIEQILMSSYQTVIATSHRLSTLSLFDRIVVLRDGSIMFDGKFDEYAANYKMEWGD